MKITNLFNTTNLYNKNINNNTKIQKTSNKKDTFVVSDEAKDFQTALKAISSSPDIREEKVEKIMQKMKENSYNISSKDIAEKLLSKY